LLFPFLPFFFAIAFSPFFVFFFPVFLFHVFIPQKSPKPLQSAYMYFVQQNMIKKCFYDKNKVQFFLISLLYTDFPVTLVARA